MALTFEMALGRPIKDLEDAVMANLCFGYVKHTGEDSSGAFERAQEDINGMSNYDLLFRISSGLQLLEQLRESEPDTQPDIRSSTAKLAMIFTNQSSYAPWGSVTPHRKITLTVEAICDMVPGAWHHPIDLINHIRLHPYVQAVHFTPDPEKDQEWLDSSNASPASSSS